MLRFTHEVACSSARGDGDYNFTIMSESSTRQTQLRTITTDVAEHYTWGDQCDGWHLVRTPSLSVISERMPPGTAEVAHRHAKAQQFFFVLSGELVLESAEVRYVLHAREGAHVPPHVVHQALNLSNAPVEFLVISEPPSHGDRISAG